MQMKSICFGLAMLLCSAQSLFAQSASGSEPATDEYMPPELDALYETTTEPAYFDAHFCDGMFFVLKDHPEIMPARQATAIREGVKKALDAAALDVMNAGIDFDVATSVTTYWFVLGEQRTRKFVATRDKSVLKFNPAKCIAIAQGRVRLITKY